MKKYLLIATLSLLCVRTKAQDNNGFVTDTILSVSNSTTRGITIETVEKTVVTSTKTLLQKTVSVDSATRLKFGDAVICNYLLYRQQPSEDHFLLSLTHGSTRLTYSLYVKAGVIRYVEVYRWSLLPLILLTLYLLIMFVIDWSLFWQTPFDEWGTWKEWLVNALMGIGAGILLGAYMLEGWSWNQIVVPSVFSVIVFFVTKWKYKKHALFHARSGGGKLIE